MHLGRCNVPFPDLASSLLKNRSSSVALVALLACVLCGTALDQVLSVGGLANGY